jgi:hypothetical protein
MVTTRGGPTVGIPCEDKQSCGVSDLFFSPVNIAALQQGIRYKVYVNSSGVHNIPNQSVLACAFALFGLF